MTDEERRVYAWRREILERAGYPDDCADALARNSDVNLWTAVRLLADGCTLDTALRILT